MKTSKVTSTRPLYPEKRFKFQNNININTYAFSFYYQLIFVFACFMADDNNTNIEYHIHFIIVYIP